MFGILQWREPRADEDPQATLRKSGSRKPGMQILRFTL